MKRLSPALISSRDTCTARLQQDYAGLLDAVTYYNATMAREWAQVQKALERYNASVAQAHEWCKAVQSALLVYRLRHSPAWDRSDAGKAHMAWEEVYATPNLVPMELARSFTLELPFDTGQGEELAALPEQPGTEERRGRP